MGQVAAWLDDETLLIYSMVIGGPIILDPQGNVLKVAPDLMGRECDGRPCSTLSSTVSMKSAFHILMQDPTSDESSPDWLLYHSEDGSIESLPPLPWIWFSSDGRSMAGSVRDDSASRVRLWWRPVDPPQWIATVFDLGWDLDTSTAPLTWSPDSSMVAFAVRSGVGVARLSPEAGVKIWSTGDYQPTGLSWSGDSRLLAVTGYVPSSLGVTNEAMFLVSVR